MAHDASKDTGQRIEISGHLDRHSAEVLQLTIRRLAKRHGVEVKSWRIEEVTEKRSS